MQQVTIPSEPLQIRVSDGLSRHGEPPWAEQLLSDGRNLAVLICNSPGQTNDAHVHPDFNEWWIVLKGELVWEISDYEPIRARKGDVVWCPAGMRHHMKTVGNESSLRLGSHQARLKPRRQGRACEQGDPPARPETPTQPAAYCRRRHAGAVRGTPAV